MSKMAQRVRGDVIPRFVDVRRVPTRYQHMLPLEFMLQFQCMVLGAAPGVLTMAITDRNDAELIVLLSRLTGCSIFPVLVDTKRMKLILRRLERARRQRAYAERLAFIVYLL